MTKELLTNLEKIKQMDADELAGWLDELLGNCANSFCEDCPIKKYRGQKEDCGRRNIKTYLEAEAEK